MGAASGFFVSKTSIRSVKNTHYKKSIKCLLCSTCSFYLEASHKILMLGTNSQEGENYYLPWKEELGTVPPFFNKDFLLFFSILTSLHIFFGAFRESFIITGAHTLTETSWQCFILIDNLRSRKKHTDNLSVLLCSHGKFIIYPTMKTSSQRSVEFHQFVNLKSLFSSPGRYIDQHSFTGHIYHICLLRSNSSGRSGDVYKLAHKMINSVVMFDMNFITWLDAEEIYEDKLSNWT